MFCQCSLFFANVCKQFLLAMFENQTILFTPFVVWFSNGSGQNKRQKGTNTFPTTKSIETSNAFTKLGTSSFYTLNFDILPYIQSFRKKQGCFQNSGGVAEWTKKVVIK